MSESEDGISHALVWYEEVNKIDVVAVKQLCNFTVPDDKTNFVRNRFIAVRKGKSKKTEAIVLALGSEY